MQEGFNLASEKCVNAIFKHGSVDYIDHPSNFVESSIRQITSINYRLSPFTMFEIANNMMYEAINNRMNRIRGGRIVYLENGVREFGYSVEDPHFEIVETVYRDELVYPDYVKPNLEDVKYSKWPGGIHWYARVNKDDVVDAKGNQKWNTQDEARKAAEWYLMTYY